MVVDPMRAACNKAPQDSACQQGPKPIHDQAEVPCVTESPEKPPGPYFVSKYMKHSRNAESVNARKLHDYELLVQRSIVSQD